MADQRALPLRDRFTEWISDVDKRKGEGIEAVKKKRPKLCGDRIRELRETGGGGGKAQGAGNRTDWKRRTCP